MIAQSPTPVRYVGLSMSRSSLSRQRCRQEPAPPSYRLTVWETAVPELFDTQLLNTFFRQSPSAGNHDRGLAGWVSENPSILDTMRLRQAASDSPVLFRTC